jgi:hypothetical protein
MTKRRQTRTRVALVLAVAVGSLAVALERARGQKGALPTPIDVAVAQTERAVRAFDALAFQDPKRAHLALGFKVSDGRLELDGRPAQVRSGKMPYQPVAPADGVGARVIYRGGQDVLGLYALEDPRNARSCEAGLEQGKAISPIKSGAIELLLPDDGRITSLDLLLPTGEQQTFDVTDAIAKRR